MQIPLTKGTGEFYKVGCEYRDTGKPKNDHDQLLGWINLPKSGLKNTGGIRGLRTLSKSRKGVDGIVLTSSHHPGDSHNPWDDIVDHHMGMIRYWGDAKRHDTKRIDDWFGNKYLRNTIDIPDDQLYSRPFILHFTRKRQGYVQFNGLCVLESLDLAWFQDGDVPVQNYRATLRILDCSEVNVDWLIRWRVCTDKSERLIGAPKEWIAYVNGKSPKTMRSWASKIKKKDEQLPKEGTPEAKALAQLSNVDPFKFEKMLVSLIKRTGKEIIQDIEKTRDRGDGGFDFFGSFILPEPFNYEIMFKGEVKRHRSGISPEYVSRLVARLDRGEYGIFMTTSYFTKQAQEEVYEMRYPVHLVDGAQLISMFKRSRIWKDGQIDPDWINSFS